MTKREEVAKKEFRADILTRITIYMVGVAIVALLSVLTYDTWLANEQRNTILDCTQVNGKCFQRSETRMQRAVADVIKSQQANARATKEVIIYASYCAKISNNQTVKGVELCVKNLLTSTDHATDATK